MASGRDIDVGGIFPGTVVVHEQHRAPYEKWGDWIVLISSLVVAMLGVRFFIQRTVV